MTDHDDSALIAPAIQEQLQLGAAARIELPRVREQLADAYAAAARSATERDEARAELATARTDVHHDIARQIDILAADPGILRDWLTTCDPQPTSFGELFHALSEKLRRVDGITPGGDHAHTYGMKCPVSDCRWPMDPSSMREQPRPGSSRRAQEPVAGRPTAEQVAKLFHDTYEQLAPKHGYQTRQASAKPWTEVPPQNRGLMVATCARVLLELFGPATGGPVEPRPGWAYMARVDQLIGLARAIQVPDDGDRYDLMLALRAVEAERAKLTPAGIGGEVA